MEESFRIKHYVFYSSVIFFHTRFFQVFYPATELSFLNRFRENFRVKTILCRYQMYIVTLQLGIDIVMKVELCISTLMMTASQSSMFLYFRFLVSAKMGLLNI